MTVQVPVQVRVREMAKRFESCETQKATRSRETEMDRLRMAGLVTGWRSPFLQSSPKPLLPGPRRRQDSLAEVVSSDAWEKITEVEDSDALSTCSTASQVQEISDNSEELGCATVAVSKDFPEKGFTDRLREWSQQRLESLEAHMPQLEEFASGGLPEALEERVRTRAYFLYVDGSKDEKKNYFQIPSLPWLLTGILVHDVEDFENMPRARKVEVKDGLFRGGGFELLGVQMLVLLTIIGWSVLTMMPFYYLVGIMFSGDWRSPRDGLRVDPRDEVDGLDRAMHGCSPKNRGKVPGMSQPTKSISFANERSEAQDIDIDDKGQPEISV